MASDIRTDSVYEALKQLLPLLEDDDDRQKAERYVEASRTALDRAVFDLVSQVVDSIDERVQAHYRVRLAYRPGGLAVEVDEKTVTNGEEQKWSLEGDVEKITIRIPAELKDLAQQAASQAGTSANTWFVKALARAVRNLESQQSSSPSRREERRGRGSRLSGWVGGDEE